MTDPLFMPDQLLRDTITQLTVDLSCLIQEALRREMRVEYSVDLSKNGIGDWTGIKIIIRDKESYGAK
jgi:hypothetical protein